MIHKPSRIYELGGIPYSICAMIAGGIFLFSCLICSLKASNLLLS
jgi:hypothetical protein